MQHIQLQSTTGKPSEEWLSINEERIKRELKLEFTIADCSCGARTLFSIESGVVSDSAKDESLQLTCPGCETSKTINVPSSTQGAKLNILESWFVEELVQEPNTMIPCRQPVGMGGPIGIRLDFRQDPYIMSDIMRVCVVISQPLYHQTAIDNYMLNTHSSRPEQILYQVLEKSLYTTVEMIRDSVYKQMDRLMTEALQWMNSSKSIIQPLNYGPNAPKQNSFSQQYATNQPWPWSVKP
jgi:hypothetical protein